MKKIDPWSDEIIEIYRESDNFDDFVEKSGLNNDDALEQWTELNNLYTDK